jgi:Zn-dependent M32 family carboxypeptidase
MEEAKKIAARITDATEVFVNATRPIWDEARQLGIYSEVEYELQEIARFERAVAKLDRSF